MFEKCKKHAMLGDSRVQGAGRKHLMQRPCSSATGENPNAKEVVNYDTVSQSLVSEVFHRLNVRCVMDLSCKDDVMAAVALQNGILYCGITCTSLHAKLLQKQVSQVVFNSMFDQTSRFHNPHLTDVFAAVARHMRSIHPAMSEDSPQSKTSASSSSPGLLSVRVAAPFCTPVANKKKRRLNHHIDRLVLMVL